MSNIKFHLQTGFTLIEVAIVLLVVSILLGYTVALLPVQQELKRHREAKDQMASLVNAIIGFAQINGRLPCPSSGTSAGLENGGGNSDCGNFSGFIPVNTLGFNGDQNSDRLLLDPWGNPYRYYVTDSDFFEDADGDDDIDDDGDGDPDGDGLADFVQNGEMRDVGLGDNAIDEELDGTNDIDADNYTDLDADLIICDSASNDSDQCTAAANQVVGDVDTTLSPLSGNYSSFTYTGYRGVPVVIVSMGNNWIQTQSTDEQENSSGQTLTGTSGKTYSLNNDTVFVKRITGQADDFDDLVVWISSSTLFTKMIEAGQLP